MCAGKEFQVEREDAEKAREEKLLVILGGLVRSGFCIRFTTYSACNLLDCDFV